QYDNRHAYDTSASLYTIPALKFVPTSEGYYDFTENKYIYNYTDHLGNVRVSYRSNGSGGTEIIDANNYYPFGLKYQESPIVPAPFGGVPYNYKYNGKELQESGMYDYGARMYMPDLGRWGVVDPLAETSRRWSPYTYAYNNPMRFVDPDGMQNEDKIKIFNNGTIERTKDDNAYDTITNEDESKSIQIARTNVTEKNPTGDSQIGGIKSLPFELSESDGLEGSASSTYSYLQIQNYDAATQFFEFAAENTKVEFSQDTFNFSDGYSTSIISTNHSVNQSVNAGAMLGAYSFGGHTIQDGTHFENVHSHPLGANVGPSGWNDRFINNVPVMTYGLKQGDAKFRSSNPQITNTYQYGTWKWPTPSKGYFKYDSKNATFIGGKKN
ncbi:MAG: RHS repeat-associated core domain-containing protein, partial [Chryseobacterium sp.]|uniref:RHS repeat-associated core domain-containing protein n=1 Tax=Chryseobacterium sp. TaxID=1871047 RepID=UPI003D10B1C0